MSFEFRPENVRYEILERVGEGLTASVFKAVRIDSRRLSRQTVALKVLKDETTIPTLRREFETLAKVRSVHCARVLAWENDGSRAALVLEWIEGTTLEELARFSALTSAEIAEITSQIAQGLLDLRAQGLHHGDLHPRNVIVDREGCVRLVDFGTHAVQKGVIHGAAPYLSPEIWRGEATSFESDLFALGLISLDLASRFTAVPTSARARERSEIVADDNSPLLHPDPSQRRPAPQPADRAAAELAAKVSRALESRTPISQTAVIPIRRVARFGLSASLTASVAAFVIASSLSVRAEAPPDRDAGSATLEIRSLRWLAVEVNGRAAGFSPLQIHGLKPGFHRLKWRDSAGQGEVRIELSAGSHLKLSEDDLRRLAKPVNH